MEPLNMPEILFYKPDSELNDKFMKHDEKYENTFFLQLILHLCVSTSPKGPFGVTKGVKSIKNQFN